MHNNSVFLIRNKSKVSWQLHYIVLELVWVEKLARATFIFYSR